MLNRPGTRGNGTAPELDPIDCIKLVYKPIWLSGPRVQMSP